MGLLSHMEALQAIELQRQNGLTECSASSTSSTELFDFHIFAQKNGLSMCAVMVPFNNRFFMRYSHGFDVETILKSVSTVDFWEGTIQSNDWNTYSRTTLEPFYQFFSQQFLTSINKLQIKTFDILDSKAILIIMNDEIQQECINNQFSVLKNFIESEINNYPNYYIHQIHNKNEKCQNPKSFIVDFSDMLDELSNQIDSEVQNILLPVIKSEIYNKISKIIDISDYCILENEKIFIEFYSAQSLEKELLEFQLNKILGNFLQKDSKKISVYSN